MDAQRVSRQRPVAAARRAPLPTLTVTIVLIVCSLGLGVWVGRDATGTPIATSAAPLSTTSTAPPENPVIAADFPDPHISQLDDGSFIALSTNSGGLLLPMSRSTDLRTWTEPVEVLQHLPNWARTSQPDLWAPAHIASGDEHLVFFAARGSRSGRHCIGAARSPSPMGPYVPEDEPVICNPEEGGSIDPYVYQDEDGTRLLWKSDGNCCDLPSILWSQPIDMSTLQLSGERSELLRDHEPWERGVVEAPEMFDEGGRHWLLYSGGGFAGGGYGVGAARCESAVGPCARVQLFPFLSSTPLVSGPGGQSVVAFEGELWMAYHGWDPDVVGYDNGGTRSMRIDRLSIDNDIVTLEGPTLGSSTGSQPEVGA